MGNKCFICGKERGEYDVLLEERDRYPSHIENQHNKWNYVYYLGYLLDKDENDYTGNEQYIAELFQKKELSWFPQGQSISLSKLGGELNEKDVFERVLGKLSASRLNIEKIKKNFESI